MLGSPYRLPDNEDIIVNQLWKQTIITSNFHRFRDKYVVTYNGK